MFNEEEFDKTALRFNKELFNKECHESLFPQIANMPLLVSLLKTDTTCLTDWLHEVDEELFYKYKFYLDSSMEPDTRKEDDLDMKLFNMYEKLGIEIIKNDDNPFEKNDEIDADVSATIAALSSKDGEDFLPLLESMKRRDYLLIEMNLIGTERLGLISITEKGSGWGFDGPLTIRVGDDIAGMSKEMHGKDKNHKE